MMLHSYCHWINEEVGLQFILVYVQDKTIQQANNISHKAYKQPRAKLTKENH